MQLRAWLNRERGKITLAEVAKAIGVAHPATVQKHADGITKPDIIQQGRYKVVTGGEVTSDDWLNLHTGLAGEKRMPRPRRAKEPADGAPA